MGAAPSTSRLALPARSILLVDSHAQQLPQVSSCTQQPTSGWRETQSRPPAAGAGASACRLALHQEASSGDYPLQLPQAQVMDKLAAHASTSMGLFP